MNIENKKVMKFLQSHPRYLIIFKDGTSLGFTVDESAAPQDMFTEDPQDTIDYYENMKKARGCPDYLGGVCSLPGDCEDPMCRVGHNE